jgi:hypothetical protein
LKVVVASPHRYADLARLWFRSLARDLLPALRAAGAQVEVLLFRDTTPEGFEPRFFPGATLLAPSFEALDFIAFYDAALERPGDILFLLDADVFVLDGEWAASLLGHFEDPTVAAVSLLRRTEHPGVFALLARREVYCALPAPVFAPSYEALDRWPHAVNRQPGDRAAMALRARGKQIVDVTPAVAASHLADFHGTTVVRASREIFGGLLGPRFNALFAEKPYFAMGAYDNLLLGSLFRAVFGSPFAAGRSPAPFAASADDTHLSGSATPEELRAALATIRDRTLLARLVAYFERSDRALTRLAAREGLTPGALHVPRVLPRGRVLEAHAWAAVRRLLGRST